MVLTDIDELHVKWNGTFPGIDLNAIDAANATYLSTFSGSSGPPLWLILVGVSSSGKSVILKAYRGAPSCLFIDEFTGAGIRNNVFELFDAEAITKFNTNPNDPSLTSAQKRIYSKYLVSRPDGKKIPKRVLIIEDMGRFLQEDQKLFASLRSMYEGHYTSILSSGIRELTGRITVLAAATPAIDSFQEQRQELGERFVLMRLREPQAHELRGRPDPSEDDPPGLVDIKKLTDSLLLNRRNTMQTGKPAICDTHMSYLKQLSSFVAQARAAVNRDEFTGVILTPITPELPHRLDKQLLVMYRNLLRLYNSDCKDDGPFQRLVEIGVGSMPYTRFQMHSILYEARETTTSKKTDSLESLLDPSLYAWVTSEELSAQLRVSRKTVEQEAETLHLLGLVHVGIDAKNLRPDYSKLRFNPELNRFFEMRAKVSEKVAAEKDQVYIKTHPGTPPELARKRRLAEEALAETFAEHQFEE